MVLRWVLIEHFLFTDAETTQSLCLTLDVFELDRDIKASLVEVGGSFIVIKAHIHICHLSINPKTLRHLTMAPVSLAQFQVFTDSL